MVVNFVIGFHLQGQVQKGVTDSPDIVLLYHTLMKDGALPLSLRDKVFSSLAGRSHSNKERQPSTRRTMSFPQICSTVSTKRNRRGPRLGSSRRQSTKQDDTRQISSRNFTVAPQRVKTQKKTSAGYGYRSWRTRRPPWVDSWLTGQVTAGCLEQADEPRREVRSNTAWLTAAHRECYPTQLEHVTDVLHVRLNRAPEQPPKTFNPVSRGDCRRPEGKPIHRIFFVQAHVQEMLSTSLPRQSHRQATRTHPSILSVLESIACGSTSIPYVRVFSFMVAFDKLEKLIFGQKRHQVRRRECSRSLSASKVDTVNSNRRRQRRNFSTCGRRHSHTRWPSSLGTDFSQLPRLMWFHAQGNTSFEVPQ